jgi:hypothetical protein
MSSKRKTWIGRVYLGRDADGQQQFYWVGRFAAKRERDDAVALAKVTRPWEAKPPSEMTGDEVADAYLRDYAERAKASSVDTAKHALKAFAPRSARGRLCRSPARRPRTGRGARRRPTRRTP